MTEGHEWRSREREYGNEGINERDMKEKGKKYYDSSDQRIRGFQVKRERERERRSP